ncbi:MAG: phosphoribosyl-AMP cyclohydrolase [Promethearchaeota archaeon]|jgi:phosphoribosyl-AMP cyclohydrolase
MKKFSKKEIQEIINQLDFTKIEGNLIPVIVQDHVSNEVLMLAFANKITIQKTLETGYTHFYSRSRKEIWKKGETSGHVQEIKKLITDCDNDSILIKIDQTGAACHKGYYSCFYKELKDGEFVVKGNKIFNPEEVYK